MVKTGRMIKAWHRVKLADHDSQPERGAQRITCYVKDREHGACVIVSAVDVSKCRRSGWQRDLCSEDESLASDWLLQPHHILSPLRPALSIRVVWTVPQYLGTAAWNPCILSSRKFSSFFVRLANCSSIEQNAAIMPVSETMLPLLLPRHPKTSHL